ncbi:MAG: hypothetical protein ABIN58_06290, partial [candidate division WOR-3 bacterium]
MDKKKRPLRWLIEAPLKPNLAEELSNDELSRIGSEVRESFRIDVAAREEWDELSKEALELARQLRQPKATPWQGAANVKHPLIMTAVMRFAARAYPEIVRPGSMVKCVVRPTAPPEVVEAAERISKHMSWQLMTEIEGWEEQMDRLLHVLPVIGQVFKKIYFDPTTGRHVCRLVLPSDCYVNAEAESIGKARRITHRLWLYENDIWERRRSGIWLDIDLPLSSKITGDADAPHAFLEQHCYFDLDGDGYKEPYVVTVHEESSKVVRVAARWQQENVFTDGKQVIRIEPDHYFVHYGFIPNPDGSMNYLGFGQLLEPINAAVNACFNQTLDAGTLYNAGGGFIARGIRIRGGELRIRPNEWKFVDAPGGQLRDSIVPFPLREPSPTIVQLLSFLVQSGRDVAAVQDILSGDIKLGANMPVGTAIALVEQGLKVYTSICKRIYRSMTEEFKMLYELNRRHFSTWSWFVMDGREWQVSPADYAADIVGILPVADPTLASDVQRILKAQALKEISGRPGLNEVEITRRLVKALSVEEPEKILLSDEQLSGQAPLPWKLPPAPQAVLAQAKAALAQARAQEAAIRAQMDLVNHRLELEALAVEVAKKKAEAML